MDEHTACEQSYKNGFKDGFDSGVKATECRQSELAIRVKVAYEIMADCHSKICRRQYTEIPNMVFDEISEVLGHLLDIQASLGVLKREEDL